MTIRTVTVCPDCRAAFIVKRLPETTTCRRCRSRHTFSELKHYYQSEDKEAARKVRTRVQAQVDDLDDHYESAREQGVLDETVDEIVSEDDYLDAKGVDTDAVAEAEDRALENKHRQKSKKEIVLDAVREQDNPDREDVRAYAKQFGMDGDRALQMLDKFRENGKITGTYGGPFRLH